MLNHKVLRIAPPNIHLQNTLNKELGISKLLAQILINRGIGNAQEADKFLNIDLNNLLDPHSFSDMHKAVQIIRRAAKNKEKVMVFGDYDVDGISALALVKATLSKIGLEPLHYVPHRIKEGYGLSKNILHIVKQKNIKLLITVDCGTNSHEQIEEVRRHNIDVIVTDHHELSEKDIPAASAIINPKLKCANYKYRDLAGVGVAYKLCQAIMDDMLFEDLDLVSLGTIADVVPLTGENRIITKEGLSRISDTKRAGLRALMETSGISGKKITTASVSYIIGPRLNACGRMDTAEAALSLLMSQTQEEAEALAKIMERHNRQRQKIESEILEEAQAIIDKEINFKEHKIIVIAKEDWHQGVLGVVASKLAERFYRPTILISLTEDLCKGSARSIKNFHLFQALLECKNFLKTFGGHSHAAGIIITRNNIENFKKKINLLAKEKLKLEDLIPTLDIDMELSLSDLNERFIKELVSLEPYGTGNAEPLFYTRNLKLRGEPQILSRYTLKFWVTDGSITYQAIGFGMGSFKDSLINADYFDLVYTPQIDNWQGEDKVILQIEDIFFR